MFGFTNSRKTRNDNIKNCKNYHDDNHGWENDKCGIMGETVTEENKGLADVYDYPGMTNLGFKEITLKRDRIYNTKRLNKMENINLPIKLIEDSDWRGFHDKTIEKPFDDYPSYEEDIKNRTPQRQYRASTGWEGPSFDSVLHLGTTVGSVAATLAGVRR